ncbi:NAD(P)H dehydrogenase (quinone) [Saccharothrix coeruleofusca]|uniref:NAD(P)H-binding protein n=1 Tax=Saccharothrix coeruleofusca TaxID=33919 RepID=UPI001AEB8C7A|nr:NAD(P)H-binding protein [Saccharothrix coeruleofusca]MBP2334827.1 NAD(P)H dehydrogenase (quinone) [Saccharothrix coeruleofusca]
MTIAITGASGPLGRAAAEFLLEQVDPREVVLTTRSPDSLADFAARGARVRRADFTEPETLSSAFDGVERLLLISLDAIGARLEPQRAAIAAAVAAGVGHIVYTSLPEPVPANPAVVVPDHAGTEQTLRESGAQWTMLRNNLYAHTQAATVAGAAAAGRLVTNSGSGATAYVAREDCAAAAAAILAGGGHENQAYDITGPRAVTAHDLAALAAEVGDGAVEVVQVEDGEMIAHLQRAGLPLPAAELVTSFGASARAGYLSTVSTTVQDLTGRAPRSLEDVVRASRAS